ncbi:hypothetical protein RJ640_016090 [Escallonia rubra]|uniref:Uncharacterized protein n=1 Tax=Escallonia rubra TaxID=112253 RepID=A0AA88UJD8_9ASTE|nr:hypothetical protein RJ640_016090 [Escallonia rubra]
MKALLNPDAPTFSSISHIKSFKLQSSTPLRTQTFLQFPRKADSRWIQQKRLLTTKALTDSATIDHLDLSDSETRNPAVSSSYRSSKYPKPNQTQYIDYVKRM